MKKNIYILLILFFSFSSTLFSQKTVKSDSTSNSKVKYKKRVLESAEVDFLSSYYTQNGENAAVTGGIGTEELQDATATIIVAVPLGDDDVLTIDAGVSAYSSASSSNINPFDNGASKANAFVASSGESQSDTWTSLSASYNHSSDDRNKIMGATLSFANEYDYSSVGFGAHHTWLSNDKNTEFNIRASTFLDKWSLLYPAEFWSFGLGEGDDDDDFNINRYTITGNTNYTPKINALNSQSRNTYAVGLGFSQILSKRLQASLALDVVRQTGQLSTPFQRVYFEDVENSFIGDFHLAEDIERLPESRLKIAMGGRLNFYVNEKITLRSFYRFYKDDWKITSHTASIEIPVKLFEGRLTLYPSYRFYAQSASEHFAPYDKHQSTSTYYTSDYDLSDYHAHQYGIGVSYRNPFKSMKLWKFNFESIDLKYYKYDRNSAFSSNLITLGIKFKLE